MSPRYYNEKQVAEKIGLQGDIAAEIGFAQRRGDLPAHDIRDHDGGLLWDADWFDAFLNGPMLDRPVLKGTRRDGA
jgi:hypothetical protein